MDRLTPEQLEQCGRLFALYDVNNDSRISSRELGSALRGLNVNISEAELRNIMSEVDRNKNGVLEFDEFCEVYQRYIRNLLTEENLLATLAAFDRNNTGMLDPAEVKQLLTTQGEPLSDREVDEIFRDAGISGPFNYRDFARTLAASLKS